MACCRTKKIIELKKVLIIANHYANRSPGQRFRFEQYLSFLKANGYECHLSNIITKEDDKYFYKPGNYLRKGQIIFKAIAKRLGNVIRLNQYDLILLFREALPLGTTFIESLFKKRKAKIIFDFDDAIWLQNVSDGNKALAFLKDASKTANIIKLSDMVFAGNQYLADYASDYCNNVNIVPTTIDTEEYQPVPVEKDRSKVYIGWSGSITTIQHFKYAIPALKILKEKYGERVAFQIIGDGSYKNELLGIQGLPWKKATELQDLCKIDIGLMPLPDDKWSKGKCGLKGLQYMALEIPTIMSPVGVNSDIIAHGVDGYLASSTEEWVDCMSQLIENPTLRIQMGKAGRQTVVEKYSVAANKEYYLKYFNEVLAKV